MESVDYLRWANRSSTVFILPKNESVGLANKHGATLLGAIIAGLVFQDCGHSKENKDLMRSLS